MRIRLPPPKVCQRFYVQYELRGAQRGADVLTKHYHVVRMRVVLDGRRLMVGKKEKGWIGLHLKHEAHFSYRGLTKRTLLHELFHHLTECKGLELKAGEEEKRAEKFARSVLRRGMEEIAK